MLDEDAKPYLIEINHSPSFAAESPLDDKIKRDLLTDTFKLLNVTLK
jgi:tubulin polyglutamylase TTLL6/13